MTDLIGMSTNALMAFQTAIKTTGNNIANVNTEGYSRQTVNFSSEEGQRFGTFYFGKGVKIDEIGRAFNGLLRNELVSRTSSASGSSTLETLATDLQNIFAQPDFGTQGALTDFSNALSDLNADPASLSNRQVLLSSAEILAGRLNQLGDFILSKEANVQAQVAADIEDINSLTSEIARLNGEIESSLGSGISPNDLLDYRDSLVVDLASKIEISTLQRSSGSLDVSLGNGVSLVSGPQNTELKSDLDEFGSRIVISPVNLNGEIPREVIGTGGSIGGALKFEEDILQASMRSLGLIALSVTDLINGQQQKGLDLNNNIGQAIFGDITVTAKESENNAGSASIAIDVTDINALTEDQYSLEFDGANWTLTNLHTGDSVSGTGTLTFEGMELTLTGTASIGDTFLIEPSVASLGQIQVTLDDPAGLATAKPLIQSQDINNMGTAQVSGLNIQDTSGVPIAADIELTFNPDALGVGVPGFDVIGIAGGPLAYDSATESSGKSFLLGDIEFEVSGLPENGDQFIIANNQNASGDNRNSQDMLGLLSEKVLLGGTHSLTDLNASLVSEIGVKTSAASSLSRIDSELLTHAENEIESVRGVNLDEEAADLLRYQQAYQAAAQMVSVAEELFNILIEVTS